MTSEIEQLIEVPIAWDALEDAFENNAPEVHSYLHQDNGEVIRIVDGVADPAMHGRIMADRNYLRIDPVSSREQYRWMERFITTVEDLDLQSRLAEAIDGKGAFRRFKDALMNSTAERERWFSFRSERLRVCMEAWMTTHGIKAVERESWSAPALSEEPKTVRQAVAGREAGLLDPQRQHLHELVDSLPARSVEAAEAFLEFLKERRPRHRTVSTAVEPVVTTIARRAEGKDR